MSNTQVGNVYQQIISDVCESSRVDFEEGGVDEHVLEELRQLFTLLFKQSIHPISNSHIVSISISIYSSGSCLLRVLSHRVFVGRDRGGG
ncbi:Transcription initiation factor IIA large subunit [Lachnellula suecica]|uniref:Transcription initiation factor IIA large subunit n=1 Tax=Lachnellula suecica TaxID=602035 RepID=A0A8T9C0S3_9HELO|nr:Transcription initiation factor IIA large subunit [Lachnellula suecica]